MTGPAAYPPPVVFVVDDDPATRESLCALLTSRNLACEAFASAGEFLEHFDQQQPGCLITDYKMEEIDGMELQQQLLHMDCPLPVIVVSGYADVPLAVRAMQQGAVTLLQKPYGQAELLEAVHAALQLDSRRRRQQQQQRNVRRNLASLSGEEREVMEMLIAGAPNKKIASQLQLGLRTVERRRRAILEKMNAGSLPELARLLALWE